MVSSLDVLDEDKFSVELVVQCIRASDMPQTHHHALLLLGTAAAIFPVSDPTQTSVKTPELNSLQFAFILYFIFTFSHLK